jgi:hypothetical protein
MKQNSLFLALKEMYPVDHVELYPGDMNGRIELILLGRIPDEVRDSEKHEWEALVIDNGYSTYQIKQQRKNTSVMFYA